MLKKLLIGISVDAGDGIVQVCLVYISFHNLYTIIPLSLSLNFNNLCIIFQKTTGAVINGDSQVRVCVCFSNILLCCLYTVCLSFAHLFSCDIDTSHIQCTDYN